jgi:hypothetical protein
MTLITSRILLGMATAGALALTACQGEDLKSGSASQGADSVVVAPVEAPIELNVMAIPTETAELEAFVIAASARGDMDTVDRAVDAYVQNVDDRRRQRDFVNELWEGKNGVVLNRELALPLAKGLSDDYDMSAPTYLVGFAYWAPTASVEQDFGQVIKYWSNPNQATNATVQYRLANIYLNQDAGYYDLARATELMQTAAAGGNAEAVSWLASN